MIHWAVSLLLAGPLPAPERPLDVLVRGGRIADGTGNPSFLGDVGIRDGLIVAVGHVGEAEAALTIDASGLVVAPGFFDIHNHSDETILTDGDAQSMTRQGVTSMIFGEGPSAAPSDRFPTFDDYFDLLLERGISTNVGSFVGSSQIWTRVHGPRAGPATPEARDQMRALVEESMRDGALGVSSSLSGPPGVWIDTESLVEMCRGAAPWGGVYSTHIRTEGHGVFEAVAEALEVGRRAGVPVDVIHLKIAEHELWGRMPELVAKLEEARAAGQDVQANVYPYRAGQNNLQAIIPPWAQEGGSAAMIARLQDPSLRARLEREILNGIPGSTWYNHYTATGGWDGMLLVSFSNPEYERFVGHRMSEVIEALGRDPIDVLFQLLVDNEGSVPTVYFHHSEEDMRYALRQPFVSIGSDGSALKTEGPLSGGNPHPRYYGTFPRVLGRYVREEQVLSLEEAVRKMTSANAAKVGVFDRGLLRPGQRADVTVFDPERVIDNATFEEPARYPTGIEHVIVNGTFVIRDGEHTGARPGTILRGRGHARPERGDDMSAESRIEGLELPPAPKPLGVYKPIVVHGDLAYLSGHGPVQSDGTLMVGRVGQDLDLEGGKKAARQVGLAMLATLRGHLGSLDRVVRVVKLLGLVNSTDDFADQPKVINGCSELFRDVFGEEAGVGARSAIGTNTLPGNIPVEIEGIFEIAPQ